MSSLTAVRLGSTRFAPSGPIGLLTEATRRARNNWECVMQRSTWLLALALSAGPMMAAQAETPAPALSSKDVAAMLATSGDDMLTP